MLTTSTWTDFKNLVQAQVGSTLSTTEESRLQALANLAASRAYRAHKFWPRFLVAGEPRTLTRGYIAFSEDSFYVYGSGTDNIDGLYIADGDDYIKKKSDGTTEYTIEAVVDAMVVSGAGTTDVNGTYLRDGDVSSKAAFQLDGGEDGVDQILATGDGIYDIRNRDSFGSISALYVGENVSSPELVGTWTAVGDGQTPSPTVRRATFSDSGVTASEVTWRIVDAEGNIIYSNATTSLTPPLTGWTTGTGAAPAPLLVDVADIDTFYDVQVNGFQLAGTGGWNADRLVSSKGCYVEVGNSEVDEVYVTYKATHTSKYGDGTGGTTADIPDEWFEYMALYTARQMQIANRQSNGSPYAVIASREVEAALEDEMMKIEEQGIVDNLGRRIETGILNSTMLS